MRNASLFIILAAASFAAGAQQQGSAQQPKKQNAAPDKELVDRARANGSAGGTAPVPPEKRQAVGAGAGPHLHKTAPSPQKLPKDEPVEPPK